MRPLLRIRGLKVGVGGRELLSGVDLTLGPGERVGVVGPSGAGKTTLLMAIMGLLPRSVEVSGEVWLHHAEADMELVSSREGHLARIRGRVLGMVLQEPATTFDPLMTCGAQVMEVAEHHLAPGEARARVRALLLAVGLDPGCLEHYPHELSGGELQRLALVMAACPDPAVLLLDEPTSSLDPRSVDQVASLLEAMDAAMLVVSHDREFLDRLVPAGRVVSLGRVPTKPGREGPSPVLSAVREGRGPFLASRAEHSEAPAEPVLVARGITKSYPSKRRGPRTQVLRGVDLTLHPGETLGLLGPSGAGKTTLARILLGLDAPDSGDLAILGRAVGRGRWPKELRLRVQAVLQTTLDSFDPRLDMGVAIGEAMVLHGLCSKRGVDDRVASLLAEVGLGAEFLRRRPGQMSVGQLQRAALARAVALDPRVLICDEPTSALDPWHRDLVVDLLAELQARRGLAMVFMGHDVTAVLALAHHVVRLEQGVVEAWSPPVA